MCGGSPAGAGQAARGEPLEIPKRIARAAGLSKQVTPVIETGQESTCLPGFHNLATKALAARGSRLTRQVRGPFPPWLMLPILTTEALADDAGANEVSLQAARHFPEHVECPGKGVLLAVLTRAGLLAFDSQRLS